MRLKYLSYADLLGTNLPRANVTSAIELRTANLRNAQLTLNHQHYRDTRWPPDFPAEAAERAGAIRNNPDGTWPFLELDPDEEPPPPTEDGDPT